MGDRNRFRLFASFISCNFSPRKTAEVASGNGRLYGELYVHGFTNVTCFDKRKRNAKQHRKQYRYEYFNCKSSERGFELVIGMHPDAGTDHIIGYAIKHRVPFAVCPCCVLPSAFAYQGYRYEHWIEHLNCLATSHNMRTTITVLPMSGRNIVIAGWPN